MHRSYSSLALVLFGCAVVAACGGSSPPPTDPSGPAHTGSTTPESGPAPADSSAPSDTDTPAPDTPQLK